MIDADNKKTPKAKPAGQAAASEGASIEAADAPAKPSENAVRVNLTFYDAMTRAPLFPPSGTEIEIEWADGTSLGVPLNQKSENGPYHLIIPLSSLPSSRSQEAPAEGLEIPCDIPRGFSPMLVMRCTKAVNVDCQPYDMPSTGTSIPSSDDLCGENEESAISVALRRQEESFRFSLLAYDTCIGDYIKNPKALIDGVKLELREVEGPKHSTGPKTTTTLTTSTFRGRTFSAITKDGFAEITGLRLRQSYELRTSAPAGFICTHPPPQYLIISQGQNLGWTAGFRPCGDSPSRSVIFVQQGCPGVRVLNLPLQAGGQSVSTGKDGIWNIPAGTTGIVHFQSSGKSFLPPSIDLNKKDAPLMFMVEVAYQTVGLLGGSDRRRFRFVDEKGEAFPHRKIYLKSPSGHEESVLTDHEGWFDAEDGSRAWADEDDQGHAVAATPLLTIETW